MKKAFAFLITFLLFGFSNNNPDYQLKVVKIAPVDAKKCNVSLELHNKTGHKISFLTMYCSDSGFYTTDNPDVVVVPQPCDKNFPKAVVVARNSYRTASLQLQMKTDKKLKFRIGFRLIEIPQHVVQLTEWDTSAAKAVTVWSNALEFKGK